MHAGDETKKIENCKSQGKSASTQTASTTNHRIPTISNSCISKIRLAILQRIQNSALRHSYNNALYPPRFIIERFHRKTKLKPINQRLTKRAKKYKK